MTKIAEYFRDLAADDRYFGAEPPQPDADMLARIAEKEIARQVQARRDGNGIVLKAQDALPMPETVEPAPDQAEVAERQHEPVEEKAQEAPTFEEPAAETLMPFEDDGSDVPTDDEPESFERFEAEPEMAAPPASAPDSIAAKLQRIRAVVSQNDPQEDEGGYSEDEHADALQNEVLASTEELTPLDLDVPEEPEQEDDDDVEALLDRLDVGTPEEDEPNDSLFQEIAQDETADEEDDAQDDLTNILAENEAPETPSAEAPARAPIRARVIKVKRADLDAALASGSIEDISQVAREAEESTLSDEDEADLMRELAEVEADIAVSRGETPTIGQAEEDTTLAEDLDEEHAENDLAPSLEDTLAAVLEDTLTADEPAEPTMEAVEQPQTFDDSADTGRGESEELSQPTSDENPEPAAPATPEVDRDISRLMAETDTKMDAPESSSKRAEIAHLRAAVAAAEADQSLSDTVNAGQDEVYREDLANVVRPRRPDTALGRRRRPGEDRPAPLKLVAEQRVDDAAEAVSSGPVRPRRIGVSVPVEPEQAGESSSGFAEFAASQGASELPDLLEAAAAYLSFVEGRDQFSRPQLMTKVRMVEQSDFSREDGLRSFGQLLRDGKIEKIKGGRFTVSDRIGFKPSDRAAS
ncbi:hypothetical protein [Thalassococcus sp. S3]|uniref:hypothetical protein n=1 Tax=Thalassococcus sp. S3 TaxID=2017482 RepID=UPI0020C1EEA6|nr:hypothetical protein [Thalassococcus sp. S3]